MKKATILTLAAVVGLGGITLLVGNDDKADAVPAATNVVAGISNALPAVTNLAAESGLPDPSKAVVPPAVLSPGVDEIIQLARARVGDEVLLAYIEASTNTFALKSDEILYLHDLGVSAEVVAAMVRHGQAMQEKAELAAATTNAPVPAVTIAELTTERPGPAPAETFAEPEPAPEAEAEAAPASGETQPVTHNYFYNTLSPYGNWVEVPDYGWCWQPTVAVINSDWQPYCHNGRWVYTDCGWYWNSYYSWGWAPFHYGRWYQSPACGWVWAPGNVWGPAWVTWRYYNGYCGWAPLPPACGYSSGIGLTYYGSGVSFSFGFGLGAACYTFVPTAYFHCGTPWHYRVPYHQGIALHKNSTPINNYARGHGNNSVINLGPGTSRIAQASRTEIRRVSLRDLPTSGGRTIRSEQLSRDGNSLAVYRPRLPEQSSRPPAEITHRQQESRRRSDELAHSPAVQTATTQARINRTIAPQRGLSSSPLSRPQPSSSATAPGARSTPTAGRPMSSSLAPADTASRSETRRELNPGTISTRTPEVRREMTSSRSTLAPAGPSLSRREETPRRSTSAQVSPVSPGTPTLNSRPPAPERPASRSLGTSQPTGPTVTVAPAQRTETARPQSPAPSSPQPRMSAPSRQVTVSPPYTPRSESPNVRAPAPQPTYRAPASQPSRPAPIVVAPRSTPTYSPAPARQPSMAPARQAPAMSSPSFSPAPAPAPASGRSQPSAPASAPSRAPSGGRSR